MTMQNETTKRILKVTGHAAAARLFAELGEPIGYIPRKIGSPYAYSPTHAVYTRKGVKVFTVETSHAVREVFAVPAGVEVTSDEVAEAAYFAGRK